MDVSWSVHPFIPEADLIASQIRIHPIIVSILLRRGLANADEIKRYLNPSVENLQNPFSIPDMEKAVNRIHKAIASKEPVLVYGDYDVDGVTASAILAPILTSLGANVSVHLPHRISEGYGLNKKSLKEWLDRGISLVITVDNGITSVDAVKYIKERGADVILVDHHIPKGDFPPADAIISGAAPGASAGDAELAACGLAFKLGWALCGDYSKMESYLDLVTLGTVADLAPVEGENRLLLKLGLPCLARTQRVGLRAMMNAAGLNPEHVTYRDIAFGLGPRINAAGRMGSAMDAYRLLTTENFMEAKNLAQVLEAGNRERQKVEGDAYREAVQQVDTQMSASEKNVIVVQSPDWHEGVLGIVAARLVERYRCPSIVISLKDGLGKGSGRSVPNFSIFHHVKNFEELLESFGGHAQACGLTIREDRVAHLRKRLNEQSGEGAFKASGADVLWIDAELPTSSLEATLLKDLEKLAPFGPGNPRPLFLSRKMRLKGEAKKRGKDTLQCWMSCEDGKGVCEVIGFRSYERWQKETKDRRTFDIVYQPALKNWRGILSVELILESWR